jgi:poly(3-hydroxyalkanoate) synthetase
MANPQTDNHAREQTRRDEQARKNADAARAGIKKLAAFRPRTTEDAWKSGRDGVDARTWLLPFTAWMRAGEAAWLLCAKAWSLGEHENEPPLEPSWATRNSIRLELASMRVRDFSRAQTSEPATLILAPFALHGATIADFAPGHSIVETLQEAGVSPLLLVDCKSATPSMRNFSIDTYLADLNVVIDELSGPVNLIGLCQGGWLSLIYAARFPTKVNGLVLAGSPIDLDAAPSRLVQAARTTDLAFLERIVRLGEGRVLGQAVLDFGGFWDVQDLDPPAVADILQTDLSQEMFQQFRAWHRWTVDLPGTYYLQVVRELFRDNRLARNSFEALGRLADLKTVRVPVYLLAGQADEVTPPEQLLSTLQLVGTPREQVITATAAGSHLSLFLGANTIAREWQRIGRWIARLN